jgi:subtilisin family serine protease
VGGRDGVQDVIIMKQPKGGDLLHGASPFTADKVSKDLKEKGVKVEEGLGALPAVTAKVDAKTAERLKNEGYQIYDNSPRSLIPGFPKIYKADNFEMPKIDFVDMTEADELHKQGVTGKNQVVAVIDSGFDHPKQPLMAWKDIVTGSSRPNDPVGHGTHVAGDVLQTAPDAQIVAVRVMNDKGQGRPSDVVKGIQWAIEHKDEYNIGVINLSLGGGPDGYPYTDDPVNRAVEMAVKKGISVVAAAGNSGPDQATIGSPADDPLTLTVGSALDKKTVSTFSSRGPTDDGLAKPDVMAPGEFIVSWNVPDSQMGKTAQIVETLRKMPGEKLRKLLEEKPQLIEALGLPEDILDRPDAEIARLVRSGLPPIYLPDPDHIAAPGTSFASPEVAGIVAGLKQANPKASPAQIKETLQKTAEDMGPQYGQYDEGAGFVNAEQALKNIKNKGA